MDDSAYLQSTQYRYFTFTPTQLSQMRQNANTLASTRLQAELAAASASGPFDPLTASEELKLVSFYATTCVVLCDHFQSGSAVKATALTYLQRIYLRVSPQQLHPKTLLLPILFLAFKTETNMQSTSWFCRTAKSAGLNITKEELLAPEINIAMNLRWAFAVLHPYRGVEGIKLELLAMVEGYYVCPRRGESAAGEVQRAFLAKGGTRERVERACAKARSLLTSGALFTDVYFLYTPAQITLAGVWAQDQGLVEFLVAVKFAHQQATGERLVRVVRECAERHLVAAAEEGEEGVYAGLLLRLPGNGMPMGTEIAAEIKSEAVRIDKKLFHLKKPLRDAKGKHAVVGDAAEEERKAKKRKLEQEKRDNDDVFGTAMIPKSKLVV